MYILSYVYIQEFDCYILFLNFEFQGDAAVPDEESLCSETVMLLQTVISLYTLPDM